MCYCDASSIEVSSVFEIRDPSARQRVDTFCVSRPIDDHFETRRREKDVRTNHGNSIGIISPRNLPRRRHA